jgi:hypothetical protein
MERRRRRDRHLRRDVAVRLQELEMLDHRMVDEIDLTGDLDCLGFRLDAVKFDRRRADHLDALQSLEEIEVPPGAAEFAIGREP